MANNTPSFTYLYKEENLTNLELTNFEEAAQVRKTSRLFRHLRECFRYFKSFSSFSTMKKMQ